MKALLALPLERGVDPSAEENFALCLASENGHLEVVKELLALPLERGIDPAFRNYAIRFAASRGHLQIVKEFLALPLDRGINPAAEGNFAIRFAAEHGHLDVVRELLALLLDRGIDPSSHENYALLLASEHGRVDVVKELLALPLERGVDPGAANNYALKWASFNGHLEVLKELLDLPLGRGVDPSAGDSYALRIAAKMGHLECVELMLSLPPERGVNPAALNNFSLKLKESSTKKTIIRHILVNDIRHSPLVYKNRPFMAQFLSHPKMQSFLASVSGQPVEMIALKLKNIGNDREPLKDLNSIMKEVDTTGKIGQLRLQFLLQYYANTADAGKENFQNFKHAHELMFRSSKLPFTEGVDNRELNRPKEILGAIGKSLIH